MLPAEEMYTGQQHLRLMNGVRAAVASDKRNCSVVLYILSAGYGLIEGKRSIAPYECTFSGMKRPQLREWADALNLQR